MRLIHVSPILNYAHFKSNQIHYYRIRPQLLGIWAPDVDMTKGSFIPQKGRITANGTGQIVITDTLNTIETENIINNVLTGEVLQKNYTDYRLTSEVQTGYGITAQDYRIEYSYLSVFNSKIERADVYDKDNVFAFSKTYLYNESNSSLISTLEFNFITSPAVDIEERKNLIEYESTSEYIKTTYVYELDDTLVHSYKEFFNGNVLRKVEKYNASGTLEEREEYVFDQFGNVGHINHLDGTREYGLRIIVIE